MASVAAQKVNFLLSGFSEKAIAYILSPPYKKSQLTSANISTSNVEYGVAYGYKI